MAEEYNADPFKSCEEEEEDKQGCFDFMKKKKEEKEKEEEEEERESLFEKLRGSSSDSSSDDEEAGKEGKKKKKTNKKGLKEKIKEKLHHDGEDTKMEEGNKGFFDKITVKHNDKDKDDEDPPARPARTATPIAGFFDNIKEKLPSHQNKKEEAPHTSAIEEDGKEKKGVLGKLMEKLPGYHKEEIDNNTPPAHH